ncbi:hypothetical protein GJ496_000610 [Pomphorhynchus laevis]|nr:hypothetical protein GJ496_000610 [Pomphorhynchus laevis]
MCTAQGCEPDGPCMRSETTVHVVNKEDNSNAQNDIAANLNSQKSRTKECDTCRCSDSGQCTIVCNILKYIAMIALITTCIAAAFYAYIHMHSEIIKLRADIIQLKSSRNNRQRQLATDSLPPNSCVSIPDWFIRYQNDRTGLLDFASLHMGAYIYKYDSPSVYQTPENFYLSSFSKQYRTVISSNMEPGNCWAFMRNYGSVGIKLRMHIHPTGFTYEHIDRSISLYKDNSPREITIKAFSDTNVSDVRELGTFHFNWNTSKLQTWTFQNVDPDFLANYFLIEIHSNWGNPNRTCVYRTRIHGNPTR